MNEVTTIHLGRQAFTISVEAHKELRNYLDAIKKHVSDEGVVDEVELRMAELLAEHGVSGEKVVLPADVDFLKEQLGDPKDFEEEGELSTRADKPAEGKRLFRDTENAMLAGVAAGLSKYLGIDVLLIRLLFIIGIFTGGWGILLYAILWLLVPEAKTPSDRLQMAGKRVTIDSLREVVERADVQGAARRANNALAGPINIAFNFVLKLIGIGFMVIGLSLLLGLAGAITYIYLHSGLLSQVNVFPIGLREHLLLDIAAVVIGIIALFIVLFGMAIFIRKWPIRGWITGVLIGLVFMSLAVGSALTADVLPQVRDRYTANIHTTQRTVKPFTNVAVSGDGVDIRYEYSPVYTVSLRYYDHPDLSAIKTTVSGGTLTIDTAQYDWHRNCQTLCIPDTYNMAVTIASPNPPQIDYPAAPKAPQPPDFK